MFGTDSDPEYLTNELGHNILVSKLQKSNNKINLFWLKQYNNYDNRLLS